MAVGCEESGVIRANTRKKKRSEAVQHSAGERRHAKANKSARNTHVHKLLARPSTKYTLARARVFLCTFIAPRVRACVTLLDGFKSPRLKISILSKIFTHSTARKFRKLLLEADAASLYILFLFLFSLQRTLARRFYTLDETKEQ